MTLSLAYIVKVVAPSKVPKVLSGGYCLFTSYYKKTFYKLSLIFFRSTASTHTLYNAKRGSTWVWNFQEWFIWIRCNCLQPLITLSPIFSRGGSREEELSHFTCGGHSLLLPIRLQHNKNVHIVGKKNLFIKLFCS